MAMVVSIKNLFKFNIQFLSRITLRYLALKYCNISENEPNSDTIFLISKCPILAFQFKFVVSFLLKILSAQFAPIYFFYKKKAKKSLTLWLLRSYYIFNLFMYIIPTLTQTRPHAQYISYKKPQLPHYFFD